MGFIKCPRCNLNYIDESENFCKVCLIEMGKIPCKKGYDLDEDLELCPECGENFIHINEIMCSSCASMYEQAKPSRKDTADEYADDMDTPEEDMFESLEDMQYNEEDDDNDDEEEMM